MLHYTAVPGRTGLLAVFLSVVMASNNVLEIEVFPPNPKEGDTVYLNVQAITEKLRFSEWYRGEGIPAANQIIRYNNGDNSINRGGLYFPEAEIQSNGTLVINKIKKEMEGKYTAFIQGTTKSLQGTVDLRLTESICTSCEGTGLTGGQIAGIVIGVLAAVGAIITGVFLFFKKSNNSG